MDEVVLFDIPSTPRCHGWSLNPWKTRMALNYKNVPYKTEWTEFPDLEPKFKELYLYPFLQRLCSTAQSSWQNLLKASLANTRNSGIAPNEQGRAYTSPAINLDSSTYIQNSAKIAPELEKRYPYPSLYLDSPLLPMAYEAVTAILVIYRPISMCKVLPKLLNEGSADYISRTRTETLKKSLEEHAKDPDGEEAWKKMKGPLEELAVLIKREGGPFMMGKTRKPFISF